MKSRQIEFYLNRPLIIAHHLLGWLPECRGATDQQWIQGGSSTETSLLRLHPVRGAYTHPWFPQTLIPSSVNSTSSKLMINPSRWAASTHLIMLIISRYHDYAAQLGVSADDMYNALVTDAEKQAPDWDLQGRQANLWNKFSELFFCSLSLPYYCVLYGIVLGRCSHG